MRFESLSRACTAAHSVVIRPVPPGAAHALMRRLPP